MMTKGSAKWFETRPSRPIRYNVWIVERMRYPTDQPTNQRTQPVRGALLHLKKIHWEVQNGMT